MSLLKKTEEFCALYGIKPSRSKGQNFLIAEEIYDEIISAAEIKKDDIVLEIGPGLGFLTAKLSIGAKKVLAVELDDKLADVLKLALETQKVSNVKVINKDILDLNLNDLGLDDQKYKIVANLPYNITSFFLRRFLNGASKPTEMILMLQKEVAERIVARAPKMSLLAVSVQFYADPEIIKFVPANCFWPKPEVDSAIIRLRVAYPQRSRLRGGQGINEKDFFRLVKIGFSAKRKMLKNNLAAGYKISQDEAESKIKKAGLPPRTRAQELNLEDWIKLFEEFG